MLPVHLVSPVAVRAAPNANMAIRQVKNARQEVRRAPNANMEVWHRVVSVKRDLRHPGNVSPALRQQAGNVSRVELQVGSVKVELRPVARAKQEALPPAGVEVVLPADNSR